MKCNFCQQPNENLKLVHHLEGGVSCGCKDCLENNPDIHNTGKDVYYFFHKKPELT